MNPHHLILTCLTLSLWPLACTSGQAPDTDPSEMGALDMRRTLDHGEPAADMPQAKPDSTPDVPDMSAPKPVDIPKDMKGVKGSCDAAGLTLCDDFEASALGANYREINFGQPAITLDKRRSHSGEQSVKVTSTNFTQMLATAVPGPKFYGRVYISSDTPMNAGHNTYLNAGEGDGDPNHGEWIRIGEHREQLELNRKSDDAELLSSGDYNSLEGATQLKADTWYCLEFLFDGPGKEVRVWVDGQAISKLHATTWGASYQTFKFGYERYHGPDKTLWYDDLALGTERVGCQ